MMFILESLAFNINIINTTANFLFYCGATMINMDPALSSSFGDEFLSQESWLLLNLG